MKTNKTKILIKPIIIIIGTSILILIGLNKQFPEALFSILFGVIGAFLFADAIVNIIYGKNKSNKK